MPLCLNTDLLRLQKSPAALDRLDDALIVQLGQAPLDVQLFSAMQDPPLLPLLNLDGSLATAAQIDFLVKAPVPNSYFANFVGATVVTGSVQIVSTPQRPQLLNCGEDWSAAALVALFASNLPSVALFGQWKLKSASPAWTRYTEVFPVTVRNTLFDVQASAPVVTAPNYIFVNAINAYVGAPNGLDHYAIAALAPGSIITVVINGVESHWQKTAGIDNTNVANGIIKTVDFDPVLMPYILVRVSGN